MSVPANSPQARYPATTTTTTNTTATTTTTAVTSSQKPSAPPRMSSKPVGWHAKDLGYDWHKRADHHKYLVETGLPPVHAAVINHDWETAAELLSPSDIGLLWTPPVSQRPTMLNKGHSGSYGWSTKLLSKNEEQRNAAIIEMSADLVERTNPMGSGSVYGANLLTLCLEKHAPCEFLQNLVTLSQKHAPQYLNNPDASGKTPLYVAIQQGDEAAVAMLLDAGADWKVHCNFIHHDGTKGGPDAYQAAMKGDSDVIFELILSRAIRELPNPEHYPIGSDPLQLAKWVNNKNESDVLRLAEKFKALRFALFSFPDKSGSSLYRRKIESATPIEVNLYTLNNPLKENNLLHLSAEHGLPQQFFELLDFFISNYKENDLEQIASDAILIFLEYKPAESSIELLENCKNSEQYLINAQKKFLTNNLFSSFEKFSLFLNNVWGDLNQSEKTIIFKNLVRHDLTYIGLFFDKVDFEIGETDFTSFCKSSANWSNTDAFDFAAERSSMIKTALVDAREKKVNFDYADALFYALRARSELWSEKLIQNCPDLQKLINIGGQFLLPGLADYDPTGLVARLEGLEFSVDMIENESFGLINSDAGEKALRDLLDLRKKGRE